MVSDDGKLSNTANDFAVSEISEWVSWGGCGVRFLVFCHATAPVQEKGRDPKIPDPMHSPPPLPTSWEWLRVQSRSSPLFAFSLPLPANQLNFALIWSTADSRCSMAPLSVCVMR